MTDEAEQTAQAETTNTANRLKAEVGYFDGELKRVAFNEGDSVQTLLNKAEINFGEGQSLIDQEGEDINPSDQAQDGETYYIAGNYKQGR